MSKMEAYSSFDDDDTTSSGNSTEEETDSELPEPPENYGPPTISLGVLLDLAVNHTYRDFQILAELLKKKSETDRKISVYTFACLTSEKFRRLKELAKWVRGGNNVEKLTRKCYYLDQQSNLYIETADILADLARRQLITARMPLLHIPHAVDILSLGRYDRVPTSIKTHFLGEPTLTKMQTKVTLKWLSRLISYRLIQESAHIPKDISDIQIKNGMAIFTVPHEFKVFMILKSADGNQEKFDDDPQMYKWRWEVLKIDVLVSDLENGFGSSLLSLSRRPHLIDYCNSQLKHELDDITVIYEALHDLVVKYQIDLLFLQAQQLSQSASSRYLAVKVYDVRLGMLQVEYWLHRTLDKSKTTYKLTFERESNEKSAGLKMTHQPCDMDNLPQLDGTLETPNFCTIFNRTIITRSLPLLQALREAEKARESVSAN